MAVREFKLPDVGEGVAEGVLIEWLVGPGETVSEDQPVAVVETDKAQVDVPAPVDGTVRELFFDAGDVIPVGDVFITFDVAEGTTGAVSEGEAETAGGAEPAAGEPAAEAEGAAEPAETEAATEPADAAEAAAGDGTDEAVAETSGRVFAPPSVRRLARELGVDLGAVEGSGPSGRVTEGDVRAAAAEGGEAGAEPAEPTEPAEATEPVEPTAGAGAGRSAAAPEAAGRDRTLAAPATRKVAEDLDVDLDDVPAVEEREGEAFVTADAVREYAEAQQAAQAADAAAVSAEPAAGVEAAADVPAEETIPYRGIRRTIGEAMETSKYTAPHVTHHDTVDVTKLVETREKLKVRAEEQGIKLTYLPFVMKAMVAALQEYPVLNSQLDEENEEIVVKHYYNVGVAVATDAGLMVPVVDDVDGKGLLQLASEVSELAQKARDRSVAPEELRGSTISITNFGAVGGEYATPIINYPETAIVGLGELKQRPVVVDSESQSAPDSASGAAASTGEVEARWTLPISIAIDHRVVDGAEVAAFCNTMMSYLEEPTLLLLE